jgi:conserved oligomeric Golgi complex subunit 6
MCRWIQAECRGIGELDAPGVSDQLQAAVGALRERPELFKLCVEEVRQPRAGVRARAGARARAGVRQG